MQRTLSAATLEKLRWLRGCAQGIAPSKLAQQRALLQQHRQWCRQALAQAHLVHVAAALAKAVGAELEDLEAVGLPVDLLEFFPAWRRGSRAGFRPHRSGHQLVPCGAGHPVGSLRLQLSPLAATVPLALILIRDILRRMDASVQLWVVVEPGANRHGLRELVGRFSKDGAARVHFVEGRSITIFAQDNARAGQDVEGRPLLFVPRAFREGQGRAADELAAEEAERGFGRKLVRSRLFWEGGNLVHDGECCFVGADTVGENMCRLGLSQREVVEILGAELGCRVVCLGDVSACQYDLEGTMLGRSGQASFHLDLDLCLLGRFGRKRRPRALIADPARGLDALSAVLDRVELFAGHFVPTAEAKAYVAAEYSAFAQERYPLLLRYAATLEDQGYKVVGVPDLRINPNENLFGIVNLDFSYCNVVPGLHRGRPAVHYLHWGIPLLDAEAERRFRAAGVQPVRISSNRRVANSLMSLFGGLHCFCGPMA